MEQPGGRSREAGTQGRQGGPGLLQGFSYQAVRMMLREPLPNGSEDPSLETGTSRFLKIVGEVKFETHPPSQAEPSRGPQLGRSTFQQSAHFPRAGLPAHFLSSLVFVPRLPCLLRSGTLGVIISLILHPESGPQMKTMFYLCFLPTIHPFVLVQP